MKPALFSANSAGACPACNGNGVIYTELGFMETVETVCEECEGKRFDASVLEYKLAGRDISEVLAMSVTEALAFFGGGEVKTPAARTILAGWPTSGSGTSPSASRSRRSPAASGSASSWPSRWRSDGGIYVLDEPTSGLHLADVEQLLELLDRLVDAGKSVIVIEHHLAVMAHADWIIDLGPGAGHDGGRVVFAGLPADLVAARSTLTGQHLASYVRYLTGPAEANAAPGGVRYAARVINPLRALLRRLGVGERRWIPDEPARTTHGERVRERLPAGDASQDPEAPTGLEPGTAEQRSTDSVD